jgi:hypothetical protein
MYKARYAASGCVGLGLSSSACVAVFGWVDPERDLLVRGIPIVHTENMRRLGSQYLQVNYIKYWDNCETTRAATPFLMLLLDIKTCGNTARQKLE